MKREWVEKKEKERKERIDILTNQIKKTLLSLDGYTDEERDMFVERFYEMKNLRMYGAHMYMPHIPGKFKDNQELFDKTMSILETLPYDDLVSLERYSYKNYLDSKPNHFTGDIIITDPCYIAKDGDWPDFIDDAYDNKNSIKTFIERDTIYGDWSCTTFDTITKQPIGEFCADAGLVGVFDLSEVLAYNPSFNYHTENSWTTTLIKDFDGDVWFEIKEDTGEDNYFYYYLEVVGKGINLKTGDPIEFRTSQTGL